MHYNTGFVFCQKPYSNNEVNSEDNLFKELKLDESNSYIILYGIPINYIVRVYVALIYYTEWKNLAKKKKAQEATVNKSYEVCAKGYPTLIFQAQTNEARETWFGECM